MMSNVKTSSNINIHQPRPFFVGVVPAYMTVALPHFAPPTGNVSSEMDRRRVTLGRGVRELEEGTACCDQWNQIWT